ncbi:YHS domain-containing (seleno)protein [Aquimarina intermedia]|uniref:YHS domain-containing protein n=1 Tax=Aquimarina intermedia TaxID=350814 RepID=A0A5S5CCR3_9FLAO|nr:YHS domain-containing (seleno)protein [Aquimarina intermedia]TYP77171.1 YHS domain-containing protein [Aquimarina intermedia]
MRITSVIVLVFFFILGTNAQKADVNLNKEYAAQGYDVIEYFNGKAIKGEKTIEASYEGALYLFTTGANKKTFEANPEQYIPQFGGYCAYAIGVKSDKVDVDPKTFEIRDGKLYLFYNSWGVNTLKKWQRGNTAILLESANRKWEVLQK